ncbi:lantibiotic dehydratase C-terminal domain-containing protein [Streptomyces nogalater]
MRFLAAEPSRAPHLRAALLRHLAPERSEDAGAPPVAGVYEPETYLFGGPLSMPWVHELFTADSRAWLDVHTAVAGEPPRSAGVPGLAARRLRRAGHRRLGAPGVWQAVRRRPAAAAGRPRRAGPAPGRRRDPRLLGAEPRGPAPVPAQGLARHPRRTSGGGRASRRALAQPLLRLR